MTTFVTTYRDDSLAAALRYDDLLEQRIEELPAALAVARVREARVGRIAAGIAGLAGMLVLAVATIHLGTSSAAGSLKTGALGEILLGTWGAMGIAYALGRVGTRLRLRKPGIPRRSGDGWTDVARLEAPLLSMADVRRADAFEKASVALPLMAIALLAPLTIHAGVWAALLGVQGQLEAFPEFDVWVAMSLVIVGHAHLLLAFFGYRFAKKLREMPLSEIDRAGSSMAWRAVWWTVFASALPGAILYLIPPVLTLLTGLLFSPAMFYMMRKRVIAERAALGA
jgi:hypothetical protein